MLRALFVLLVSLWVGQQVDPLGGGWERLTTALAVVAGFVALVTLLGAATRLGGRA
ncbi:hypothetical protein [Deinococcus geothermalis]|uniref:hypothetical protein n=1 Tax=Deinococcus geothermalis TaxID=68909 RepID=UPI002353771E|nr:hypothetical protein [Deinococcus geothermalis]